ncbi:MAG: hypothetical protein M3X11_06190 [Acidobacteriota bacterium]|nr:hypothetical protein [Acidobacteriota bacterium]
MKETQRKSKTDWERLRVMTDKDIDLSDTPELTPEMFVRAVVRRGLKPVRKGIGENIAEPNCPPA